ncbi:uncharacterized protein LODBEIA_P21650 [Lodderomyces beijingensis]|uniref:Nuclear distribution protein PAC1 n=1 Tax=Lodderomyces beijingensis TaxID=1775926 RepID=A0ABP0ZLE5_9ASCO
MNGTSSILTDRQQQALNQAILQYLKPICSNSDNDAIHTQLSQLLLPTSHEARDEEQIVDRFLEKKWSTVLRLQKKIIDLENEITNIRSIIDTDAIQQQQQQQQPTSSKDRLNWLPMTSIQTFETQSVITSVQLHPVLPLVYCCCSDGSIYVWNFASDENSLPEKIIKAHTKSANQLAISWNPVELTPGAAAAAIATTAGATQDRQFLLASCSSDLTIRIYDATTYQHLRTLRGHEHTISSLAFSPANDLLYSVSRDKTIRTWNVRDGTCLKSSVGHSDWVRDLDVVSSLRDGDFLVTCSNDQSARLTHAPSGTGIAMLISHTHVIESVRFLPTISNHILDTYISNNLDLFPTLPRDLIKDDVYNKLGYKYCVTASRDNTLKIWLLPPPQFIQGRPPLPSKYNQSQAWLMATLTGHQSWVKSVVVHPNGKYIFSGSDDKTIKVWDLSGLNLTSRVGCVRTLSGHDGFLTGLDFARLTKRRKTAEMNGNVVVANGSKRPQEDDTEMRLKEVEIRLRCVFVSCATDNLVKIWK